MSSREFAPDTVVWGWSGVLFSPSRNSSRCSQKRKSIPLDPRSLRMKLVMKKKWPRNKVMVSKLKSTLTICGEVFSESSEARCGWLEFDVYMYSCTERKLLSFKIPSPSWPRAPQLQALAAKPIPGTHVGERARCCRLSL